MKGKHLLELNIKHSNVTTFSTDFSFQNLIFWNLFEFSATKKHFKIDVSHILNPNLTKLIPLNQHQRHILIPLKFSVII